MTDRDSARTPTSPAQSAMRQGEEWLEQSRPQAALACFDRAVSSDPTHAPAQVGRGLALQRMRDAAGALAAFERALELDPTCAAAHVNRAASLSQAGRPADALAASDRAIALEPYLAPAHCNRGLALIGLSQPQEALQSLDRAIELEPQFAAAHGNRGNALQALARPAEALGAYERVLELLPNSAQAQLNASHSLLALGHFERGWALYESRKRIAKPLGHRDFAQPLWLGEQSLAGRRLLIHWEQGLGDTLQFCRYARLAQARGAMVSLWVQPRLGRLLRSLGTEVEVKTDDDPPLNFDCHCPLLSLPHAFGTRLDDLPAVTPYLHAEPERIRYWREKIGPEGIKIGIAWQGNKLSPVDRGRSFSPRLFQRIATLAGVRLITLQTGDGSELLQTLPAGMMVESLGSGFDDGPDAFIDSAAVMQSLDLVITSDTAIAHLAGALARPVWVALQHAPDWRWLSERADCPWYPGMRLFRQPTPGDWQAVFEAMRCALIENAASP